MSDRDPRRLLSSYSSDEVHAGRQLLTDQYLEAAAAAIEQLGHVGEPLNAMLLCLVALSSLLPKPLGAELVATSAAGKSHLVDTVMLLFPEEFVFRVTSMSDKALYYARDLRHFIVYVKERDLVAERSSGSLPLREMLSAGRLERAIPIEARDGGFETRLFTVEGPISYIETTTEPQRHDEDSTRILRLNSDESAAHTRQILNAIATQYENLSAAGADRESTRRAFCAAYLLARSEMLGAERLSIRVPYARQVVHSLPGGSVRVRRLGGQLMGSIQAVVLSRLYAHQIRMVEGVGRVVNADEQDWRAARPLLLPVVARVLSPLDDRERAMFDAIERHTEIQSDGYYKDPRVSFTYVDCMKWVGVSRSTVERRLKKLIEYGYAEQVNVDQSGGRGRLAEFVLTDARPGSQNAEECLPEDVTVDEEPDEDAPDETTSNPGQPA